ncbi:hypothetical protein J3459_022315 [Metarhizium acridum]|nr:hypothetical protein J3459_022315 [Metarhizium acridum]
MRPANYLPGPSVLLAAIAFLTPAMGQKDSPSSKDDSASETPSPKDTGKSTPSPSPSSKEEKSSETPSPSSSDKASISNTGTPVTTDPNWQSNHHWWPGGHDRW